VIFAGSDTVFTLVLHGGDVECCLVFISTIMSE